MREYSKLQIKGGTKTLDRPRGGGFVGIRKLLPGKSHGKPEEKDGRATIWHMEGRSEEKALVL